MDNNNCEIKFEKITTGNGFQNDLIATANNRVELAVVEICKLKDIISKFEKTIIVLDDKNERLQKKVLWLNCNYCNLYSYPDNSSHRYPYQVV